MDDVSAATSAVPESTGSAWEDLRLRLAPLIGDRAFAYFAQAVSSARGDSDTAERFRAELLATGNDPDHPQVTETETLLIEWGGRAASGTMDAELSARAEAAFSAQLSALLDEGVALEPEE